MKYIAVNYTFETHLGDLPIKVEFDYTPGSPAIYHPIEIACPETFPEVDICEIFAMTIENDYGYVVHHEHDIKDYLNKQALDEIEAKCFEHLEKFHKDDGEGNEED